MPVPGESDLLRSISWINLRLCFDLLLFHDVFHPWRRQLFLLTCVLLPCQRATSCCRSSCLCANTFLFPAAPERACVCVCVGAFTYTNTYTSSLRAQLLTFAVASRLKCKAPESEICRLDLSRGRDAVHFTEASG
jgi:hypothetical protein